MCVRCVRTPCLENTLCIFFMRNFSIICASFCCQQSDVVLEAVKAAKLLMNKYVSQAYTACALCLYCTTELGLSLTHTHTAHVHARGRMLLQLHAIVKYNANYADTDTARYCVKLQQKSRNTLHKELDFCVKARARTYVAAVSEHAVIEINVFDYNVSKLYMVEWINVSY